MKKIIFTLKNSKKLTLFFPVEGLGVVGLEFTFFAFSWLFGVYNKLNDKNTNKINERDTKICCLFYHMGTQK